MPRQSIDDDGFLGFLRAFGELAFTNGEVSAPGYPDLNVVSNVGRTTPPRSTFHVDTSYVRWPPAYTALRAVEIPAEGGETLFTNQYRAYDTLPRDVHGALQGRTVTHVVTGLSLSEDDETTAEHPAFRPHPLSGRTALYLSTPSRCAAIRGLSAPRPRRPWRSCSSTPHVRRTSCVTAGHPVTSSCGTTAACCTAPTTRMSSATE